MHNIFKISLLTLSLISFGSSSTLFAADQPKASTDANQVIRDSLKQNFPDLTIDQVTASPLPGLYQVTAGAAVIYVSQDGRYLFSGDMLDLKNAQENITENARKGARLNALKSFGDANMVVFPAKNPKYTITAFTDITCGYCHKLHSEIDQLNEKGITVRYLAFPRSGPNTPTFDKMAQVWCAKDKQKAFTDAISDKTIENTANCSKESIAKEFQLGMMMGVNGTPTLILEDGTMLPGYMPPDKLLEAAEKAKAAKK